MKKEKAQPKNVESYFDVKDIFFSTTNTRGVILEGNKIFYEVSKYPPEEMRGEPHNIVRHPDMPKVIFKLFWDYIKSKKPVIAYIKNLAKDGSYYWVMALAMPIVGKNGTIKKYLSIRIKPTGKFFEIIPELYKKLAYIEKRYSLDDALSHLQEELEKIGFKNYDDFMFSVLRDEILDKWSVLRVGRLEFHPHNKFLRSVYKIFKNSKQIDDIYEDIYLKINKLEEFGQILKDKSNYIFNLTDNIRLISLNSSVESFKLGSEGASFSVLSAEMRKNSEIGNKVIEDVKKTTYQISEDLTKMINSLSISKLQILTMTQFLKEFMTNERSSIQSLCDLIYLLIGSTEKDIDLSRKLNKLFAKISEDIKKLKILIKRLEFLYLNGMVESAHQTETSFSIIFTEVNKLVESTRSIVTQINNPLSEVTEENKKILENVQKVTNYLYKIQKELENINVNCQVY